MFRFVVLISVLMSGCAASSHAVQRADLGRSVSGERMIELGAAPGPVELTPVVAAHWRVDRSGMLNLDHPRAVAAGLEDEEEPIVIRFYVLRHPKYGTYLVDSGVASSFRSEDTAPVSWLIKSAMDLGSLRIEQDTRQWLEENGLPDGMFLTHVHLDHVMGVPDLPADVPVYTGPGEAASSEFMHLFSQGSTDDMLEHVAALREWRFERDTSGRFAGVIDVFGDASVFALHVPGHTPGSTAFLVRTTTGPELITGDACHTRWGWEHRVEPGTFSADRARSVTSLAQLKMLERDLPGVVVHLGHQDLRAVERTP